MNGSRVAARRVIAQYSLPVYFGLAYAITWLIWTPLALEAWGNWRGPLLPYAAMNVAGIVGFLSSLATGAILLTWLYNSSGGSLLIAMLFHGSINVVFNSQVATGTTVNAMGALVIVWAVLVVIFAGTANLSRSGKHTIGGLVSRESRSSVDADERPQGPGRAA